MQQLKLFERDSVKMPEPETEVKVGKRTAQVPLAKRRREALEKLIPTLNQLEGKDVYISYDPGARNHFWLNDLRLCRLQLGRELNVGLNTFTLWGSRGAAVRIDARRLCNVREQEYMGYTLWILDFWNGFSESPIDPYLPGGYVGLTIKRMKD